MSRLTRGKGKAIGEKVKYDVFPLYFNLKFNFFYLSSICVGQPTQTILFVMRGPSDATYWLICVGQTDENLKLIFFSFQRRDNFCF